MSALHTCISCRVAFCDSEAQRNHYKSDWHRYNLKRKVAELPPVTAEVFNGKVLEHREQQSAASKPSTDELRCIPCRKTFSSLKALENHKNSKKHEGRSRNNSEQSTNADSSEKADDNEEESDSEGWEEGEGGVGIEECLFCSLVSKDLDSSLEHMSVKHGFFIPDVEYCIDLTNLILYLGQKVGLGFYCLWCDEKGKRFRSLDGVQKHMRDKGHCKLQHDGDAMLEYSDYFDFQSSYPEGEQKDDENKVEPIEMDNDWQLVLPSGSVVGHRSLARYFKQNLKPVTTVALKEKDRRDRVIGQYKALGWIGERGEAAYRKARDIKFMNNLRARNGLKLGVQANKLQPHFRRTDI